MKTRTRTTIEHMRPSVARALTPASCSVVGQSDCRTRGYLMIDIYSPQPKKRVRASKFARSVTIWDYCGGRRPAPFVLRALAFLLIVALNAFTLGNVGTTAAYYLDGETLRENSYVAGSVDFILSSTPYSPLEVANNLISGAVATRTVSVIPELGSNSFWYHASSTNFGTDIDFCESLTLASSLEGVQNYSGLLTNFTSSATTTLTSWQFDISTNSALSNKVCTFDVEFTAWQERHNVPGFTEMGYYDIEKETNKIASQGLRLNKVYYDVFEGSTPSPCGEYSAGSILTQTTSSSCTSITSSTSTPRGSEGLNEWVEVYNQTNVEQDISGWSICDNTSCDVIPRTAIIPPFGYAIITPSSSTLALWNIPVSFPHAILSDGTIGSGLDNDNDMLILKRPDGVIMDQMNYGQSPNIGWANYNDGVWIPGAVDVPEGDALARNPNGYDTDQPSDWAGFGVPTITLINPSSSSGGTWNFDAPHDIYWSATNPNGPNADLLIDIYLVKDEDGSRTVTPLDTIISVVLDMNNDGHYYMEASSGFSGYFWVKVVATGSENPLLNDVDYSGKFYGSSLCKTSGTKSSTSSTSGCTTTSTKDSSSDTDDTKNNKHRDDKDDDDDHLADDKKRTDDKKHDEHEEGEGHVAKDSSEHHEEDSNKESDESLAHHDDDSGKEEVLGEYATEYGQQPKEPILQITVVKKEEESVVIIEKSTTRDNESDIDAVLEPALPMAPEPEIVAGSVVMSE